jgi:hypothetical protein
VLRDVVYMLVTVLTTTLWRPIGPAELRLLEENGWTAWPPRLPEQPIFYPVLNRDYATRIARDWNVKHDGAGYVTEFDVETSFLDAYEVHQVGGQTILEYWIPAEELELFNQHIVGRIRLVDSFMPDESRPVARRPGPELISAVRDAAWIWDPYGIADSRSEVPEEYDDIVDAVLENLRTAGSIEGLESWVDEYLEALGLSRHPPSDRTFVQDVWRAWGEDTAASR